MPSANNKDYAITFGSDEGRRVLKDLLGYRDRISFDPNPYQTAFNEGQRSVVLRVTTKIKDLVKEIENG
jgi:hypothetical protein